MATPNNVPATNKAAQAQASIASKGGIITVEAYEHQLKQWWVTNGKKMASLAGTDDEAKQIFVTAMNVMSKTPKLIECDFNTIAACMLTSAETKLYPGYAQECAYVPLKLDGKMKAEFWTMYQGIVKHVYNGGVVSAISCDVVYSNDDEFDYRKGTNSFLIHKPKIGSLAERGKRLCAYVAFTTRFGETQFEIVSMDFCEYIKGKSRGAQSSFSPWNSGDYNYNAMCRKTAIKQGAKLLPKSRELAAAIELDQEGRTEKSQSSIFSLGGFASGLIDPEAINAADENAGASQGEPQKSLEQSTQQTVDVSASANEKVEVGKTETKEERDKRLLG